MALTFAASTGNVSTYQVVLYDAAGANGTPGTILYTSATQTRTAAAGTTTVTLPSVQVPATFYIGVKELDTNPALLTRQKTPSSPPLTITRSMLLRAGYPSTTRPCAPAWPLSLAP